MKKVNSILKLDIACGKNKKPGFTGVDIWDGADIVADLNIFPWPFEDSSVDAIYCTHFIEHTPDLISFVNELYRIMKIGATAEIIAPYYSSIRAWQDPTHLRAISEKTFNYFNKKMRLIHRLDHYPLIADFDCVCSYILSSEWADKPESERNFAIRHYINVVNDIHAVLTKRTPCDDAVQMSQLALECWEKGDFERAVTFCNQLVSQGKADSSIFLMLAEYAFRNKSYTNAIDSFRLVLEGDEDSMPAHIGLVRSMNMAGLTIEAQIYIDVIKKRDSELADQIMDFINLISI